MNARGEAQVLRGHIEADADSGESERKIWRVEDSCHFAERTSEDADVRSGSNTLPNLAARQIYNAARTDGRDKPRPSVEVDSEVRLTADGDIELLITVLVPEVDIRIADPEIVGRIALLAHAAASELHASHSPYIGDRNTVLVNDLIGESDELPHCAFEAYAFKWNDAIRSTIPDRVKIRYAKIDSGPRVC